MKKHIYYPGLIALALAMASCGENKQAKVGDANSYLKIDRRMDFEVERTGKDTVEVMRLAKQYLELLKNSNYNDALAMLVEVDEQCKEVKPLSDNRAKAILKNMQNFPVLSYNIDELRFYSDMDTEVRYTITWYEKESEEDTRPNTIKGAVFPRRIDGNWFLTVVEKRQER